MQNEYPLGWRYIVWVDGVDYYYKNYNDAKRSFDDWEDKGYDDVVIEIIEEIP